MDDEYRSIEEQGLDLTNGLLGISLVLAPYLFQFADGTATLNACIVGVATSLIATAALLAYTDWEEFANIALGLWAIAAPWALGFSGESWAMRAHVAAGALIAAVAALQLVLRHSRLSAAPRERYRRARIRR